MGTMLVFCQEENNNQSHYRLVRLPCPSLFRRIVAVGKDIERRGNLHTGSVLVESMMVAGR